MLSSRRCRRNGREGRQASNYALTCTPTFTELTPVGVHAAPVAGSTVSVRHMFIHVVASVALPLSTVVPPLLSSTLPEREPASLLLTNARVVTATVPAGVTPIGAIP